MADKIEFEVPLFRATINEVGQIVVPKKVRDLFDIEKNTEIVLKYEGKISTSEEYIKA